MPIYEYQCDKCGEHFEVVQKFDDAPLKKCTSCGGKLQKLISQSSFHLKGSGWYATDYAKKSTGGDADGPKKDTPPSEEKKTVSKEKEAKKPAASGD